MTSLILCKFPLFSQFIHRLKIKIFECLRYLHRLYLHSPQFKQRLKTGILNVALGSKFQFFTIYERDKKLEFSRLGLAW